MYTVFHKKISLCYRNSRGALVAYEPRGQQDRLVPPADKIEAACAPAKWVIRVVLIILSTSFCKVQPSTRPPFEIVPYTGAFVKNYLPPERAGNLFLDLKLAFCKTVVYLF